MPPKAAYSTPLLHVADIERSIRFYETLGFTIVDTDRCQPLGWARLHCEGGALMFLRAEHTIDPSQQGLILYMYTPDLPALRQHLLASGLQCPEIRYPEYMLSGEIVMKDPDGYVVMVGHWGEKENQEWLKRIGKA
ncbi:MAG TPA: VOC family protein [Terriglobales bacterium]|nr:VOC family protein [Terriglobales bacterium]